MSWRHPTETLPLALQFRRRYGVRVLGMPPWTPAFAWRTGSKSQRSGRYAAFDAELRTLLQQLPTRPVQVSFVVQAPASLLLSCRRAGFRVFPRLVYQLTSDELGSDPQELLNRNHRRDLRHALAQPGWQTDELNTPAGYRMFARHYRSLNTHVGIDAERYRAVTALPGVRARGLFDAHQNCLAGLVTLRDGDRVYAQVNYQRRQPADRGALVRLYVAEMQHWRNAGVQLFDFNGSMLPGVEPFLRGFGGRRTLRYFVRRRWFGI